ncbi:MAG TPA: ribosome biogenesis GTP-binding protein YihA/YsxC [Rhizomicrobium sp.]|nr:ribosome biogenesis GTP-binding protein YihA/YsxC [Rhizomicrobium sp.]
MNGEKDVVRRLFSGPCEFAFGGTDNFPDTDLPEVAFAGRSNAGKSSLINALANRKTLARASKTPGRTRQINFFRLANALMLVDLPGYGFARASRNETEEWQRAILAYLNGRSQLKRVILLIDARRGIMAADAEAMALFDRAAVSYAIALTKIDALKRGELAAAQTKVEAALSAHAAAYPAVFAVSAKDGAGLDELRAHIAAMAARR